MADLDLLATQMQETGSCAYDAPTPAAQATLAERMRAAADLIGAEVDITVEGSRIRAAVRSSAEDGS